MLVECWPSTTNRLQPRGGRWRDLQHPSKHGAALASRWSSVVLVVCGVPTRYAIAGDNHSLYDNHISRWRQHLPGASSNMRVHGSRLRRAVRSVGEQPIISTPITISREPHVPYPSVITAQLTAVTITTLFATHRRVKTRLRGHKHRHKDNDASTASGDLVNRVPPLGICIFMPLQGIRFMDPALAPDHSPAPASDPRTLTLMTCNRNTSSYTQTAAGMSSEGNIGYCTSEVTERARKSKRDRRGVM